MESDQSVPVQEYLRDLCDRFSKWRLQQGLVDSWIQRLESLQDLPEVVPAVAVRLGPELDGVGDPLERMYPTLSRLLGRETGLTFPGLHLGHDRALRPGSWQIELFEEVTGSGGTGATAPEQQAVAILAELDQVMRSQAGRFLSLQQVEQRVSALGAEHPLLARLVPEKLGWPGLRQVLVLLVAERVWIRDLPRILQCVLDNLHLTADPEMLCEFVRVELGATTCGRLGRLGQLQAVTLSDEVTEILQGAIRRTEAGNFLTLESETGLKFLRALAAQLEVFRPHQLPQIVLTSPQVRCAVRKLTDRSFPKLNILSWNEIAVGFVVNLVGQVSFT